MFVTLFRICFELEDCLDTPLLILGSAKLFVLFLLVLCSSAFVCWQIIFSLLFMLDCDCV